MLWRWTTSPRRIAAVAEPMMAPYFKTFSPGARSRRAILKPTGASARTVTASPSRLTMSPFRKLAHVTRTLSCSDKSSSRRSIGALASITVKYLVHRRPPFTLLACFEPLLTRIGQRPPAARRLVLRHACHVGGEVVAVIFEVREQEALRLPQINGVVADAARFDHREHARPYGGVQRFVLRDLLG